MRSTSASWTAVGGAVVNAPLSASIVLPAGFRESGKKLLSGWWPFDGRSGTTRIIAANHMPVSRGGPRVHPIIAAPVCLSLGSVVPGFAHSEVVGAVAFPVAVVAPGHPAGNVLDPCRLQRSVWQCIRKSQIMSAADCKSVAET